VSDETLLAQIPFIKDVQIEMDKLRKQEESLGMGFDNHAE
ncbi:hypothetical protein EVA_14065, partial [gut metagenome]